MLGMDLIMGGSIVGGLMGIAVGHIYYFLREDWPTGRKWTQAPKWLYYGV
jgi:hypothetical protein